MCYGGANSRRRRQSVGEGIRLVIGANLRSPGHKRNTGRRARPGGSRGRRHRSVLRQDFQLAVEREDDHGWTFPLEEDSLGRNDGAMKHGMAGRLSRTWSRFGVPENVIGSAAHEARDVLLQPRVPSWLAGHSLRRGLNRGCHGIDVKMMRRYASRSARDGAIRPATRGSLPTSSEKLSSVAPPQYPSPLARTNARKDGGSMVIVLTPPGRSPERAPPS